MVCRVFLLFQTQTLDFSSDNNSFMDHNMDRY